MCCLREKWEVGGPFSGIPYYVVSAVRVLRKEHRRMNIRDYPGIQIQRHLIEIDAGGRAAAIKI